MKPQVKYGLLGGFVIAALAFAGWLYLTRHLVSTDDAYVHADIAPISTRVQGVVAQVMVSDNQLVRAGDVLLRIDDSSYRATADAARAAAAAAAADIDTLSSQIEQQVLRITMAEAQETSAKAEAERASRDLARMSKLATGDYATRQKLDTSRADSAKAAAALASATANVGVQKAEQAVMQTKLVEAKAARQRAEAQLALAEEDLKDTVIRAPVAGVVGNRGVVAGQYARPGAVLLSIVPVQDLWIEANFKETQLADMGAGQPVEVSVDALPGVTLHGKIESFSPASGALFSLLPPENASGNFTKVVQRVPVKIHLDEYPARLVPGLSVVVTVDTSVEPAAVAYVPAPSEVADNAQP
ncbi:HlyD family secretion protein [Zavarzinia compransoris]|uniref:HlyD family secretion protein n=1 Tax=Zavarzinia marina TaxID=2911065 RepID=UPI001F465C67|nr:HlyD family secretion protein [Zavarzinia marina]MCF4166182.1 HlyD family secretion protein [Zavarzinia marina]